MIQEGADRRKVDDRDHDLLIRIDENMKNMMTNYQLHTTQDATEFAKNDIRLSNLEKSYWKVMGGVAVVVFIAQIILKTYFN